MKAIWTESYPINSMLVNPQKNLGLFQLLNLMQDASWIHATHLGHGYHDMLKEKTLWVLTRQKLQMKYWPSWGETIQLKTWIRPPQGPFAARDIEVYHNEQVIGQSTSSWLMLDMETRMPLRKKLDEGEFKFRTDYALPFDAPKIEFKSELKKCAEFKVRNSDIDLNQHVNNTAYARWILDSMPRERHQQCQLTGYQVNFLAETHMGDTIEISRTDELTSEQGSPIFQWAGTRKQDSKIVFTAQLEITPHFQI